VQQMERADKQKRSHAASDVRPDQMSILVRMTELRRVSAPQPRVANAEVSPVWQPPEAEATILDTIEEFRWLKDAGLIDESALQHLETLASGNSGPSSDSVVTLREYVARRVKMVDLLYLNLGDEISSVPTLIEQSQLVAQNGLGHDDRVRRK
jgi:hypothetical protein